MKLRKKRISLKDMASSSKSVIHHHNIIDVDEYEDAKSDIHHHNIIDLDKDEDVDDFYIYDEDELLLISAEKYAQETLISSISERNASSSSSTPQNSQKDASTLCEASTPPNKLKRKQPMVRSEEEEGEEAKVPKSFCGICMDTKSRSEMFSNPKVCGHLFCLDCICRHVSVKIKENITKLKCPDPTCKGVIGPELCRSIVPRKVLERWEDALCESLILGTQKFYCPFKDCSAMLVDDSGKVVTSSECPNCNRLFCAQCKVAWHLGLDCREYKSLKEYERNPEDMMFVELAKNEKWKRCPSCNYFVEKRDGCKRISCRCGQAFCYECGIPCFPWTRHICEATRSALFGLRGCTPQAPPKVLDCGGFLFQVASSQMTHLMPQIRGVDHQWEGNLFATAGAQVDIWDHNRSQPVNSFEWGNDTVISVRFNPREPNILATCGRSEHNIERELF